MRISIARRRRTYSPIVAMGRRPAPRARRSNGRATPDMGKVAAWGRALHNNRELTKPREGTARGAETRGRIMTMNDKEVEDHDAHVRTRRIIERLRALQ